MCARIYLPSTGALSEQGAEQLSAQVVVHVGEDTKRTDEAEGKENPDWCAQGGSPLGWHAPHPLPSLTAA